MIDYESMLQRFYEGFLQPGMVAVDVGANIGRHAFELSRLVFPDGKVILFEPIPELYAGLALRIEANEVLRACATLYPFALSDTSGEREFCLALDDLAYSGFRERRYDKKMRVAKTSVISCRLDDLLADTPRLDYLKIDTEGSEWEVLKGGVNLIRRWRPIISFEFGENSYAPYGVNPREVWQFFAACNYVLYDILGRRLTEDEFVESSERQSVWDYIALPEKCHKTLELMLVSNAACVSATDT